MNKLGCMSIALCLFGCSSTDTTPAPADYDDVAQGLSAVIATGNGGGDMGSLTDSASIAIGTPALGISVKAAGQFSGARLGLNYDYSVTCHDATGAAQQACNHDTDDAAVKVDWSGELMIPTITASVTRSGDWTLTNIQSGTADFNGTGEFDLDASFMSLFRDVQRDYHLNYSADYADVKVQLVPLAITSGTVKYVIDAERKASGPLHERDASFHIDGTLEFVSAGHATLTLDGSYKYSVDATTGAVAKM